ncbi:MAG: bifunctional hydroxymethylpyrimidine kinase/phosphomethylpyrimidine kinase [Sandaracinaceae bacterium]|nr:bifunctional hydroxymethylpyrimidine kinase/phosphomethylpyrimidine kinase [Sandaracinaceae bacterium]
MTDVRRALPIALTIAGSDPSGGAGLQADLKTFHQHRIYGASVVTLVTVQSTVRVSRVEVLSPELVREQLIAVLDDLGPLAIKTGALGSAEVVREVAATLEPRLTREGPALVVDPVMISKHGHALLAPSAVDACIEHLFPLASLITPNVPEAAHLLGLSDPTSITHEHEAAEAALTLARRTGVPVLLKGGHLAGDKSVDLLAVGGEIERFEAPRVDSPHTHGTGCTYAAAITARLARGEALRDAIRHAKGWVTRAIASAPAIGKGIGPVDHLVALD